MKGVGMNQEERMDAMTPSREATPEEPGTPAALRLMAESLAKQVELGIVIEQAHVSEQRAHTTARRRLDRANGDRARLEQYNLDLLAKQEEVRTALAGGVHGGVASPDGDVLAEARELFAKCHNLEAALLDAKMLIESATRQNSEWERERRNWQETVRQILGLPDAPEVNPDPQYAPDGVVHPPVELPAQTPDNPWGLPEEDKGEPHS